MSFPREPSDSEIAVLPELAASSTALSPAFRKASDMGHPQQYFIDKYKPHLANSGMCEASKERLIIALYGWMKPVVDKAFGVYPYNLDTPCQVEKVVNEKAVIGLNVTSEGIELKK